MNLRPSQLFKYDDENLGIKDYEYTQLWLLHYDAKEDGQIVQDGIEVMDTQWVDLENIFRKADMRHANIYKTQDVSRYGDSADHSDSKKEKVTYTSWFLNEICYIQQYFSVANNA